MRRLFPALAALMLILVPSARAHEFLLDDLQIIHPAIPATHPDATSVPVYMVLANESSADERLLAIETPLGTLTFRKPAKQANGAIRMEAVPHIDIPAGEIVVLTRNERRGVIDGLNRPILEGGLHAGVMVFEKRGRFEMFFMVDPPDDPDDTEPGSAQPPVASQPDDRLRDLLAINDTLRMELDGDQDIAIAPIVVRGNVAIAGWTADNIGARALLKRDAELDWYVELWSGQSLLLDSTLSSMGVGRADREAIRTEFRIAESLLGAAFTRRFEAYPGTVVIGKARSKAAAAR